MRPHLSNLTDTERAKMLARLQKHSELDAERGCILWTGSIDSQGYGRFSLGPRGQQRVLGAHRVSWVLANGPIPADQPKRLVCHHCDVRACINPAHLYLGDWQDNMNDMTERRRGHAKLTNRQVVEIWGGRIGGVPVAELAAEYGVPVRTVEAILRGARRQAAFSAEEAAEAARAALAPATG